MGNKLRCIMLVDDSEADNFIHRRVIKKIGCTDKIVEMPNGKAALEYLLENKGTSAIPELVFLDINMPVMNGWEFIENYHKSSFQDKDLKIISMLSTSRNPDDVERARKAGGVFDYTCKPLKQDVLEKILEDNFS